jgi:hypothetical protein
MKHTCNTHSDCVRGKTSSVQAQTTHEGGKASALSTGRLYPRKYFQYKFLLEVEGRSAAGKIIPPGIQPVIFRIEASPNCATTFPTLYA